MTTRKSRKKANVTEIASTDVQQMASVLDTTPITDDNVEQVLADMPEEPAVDGVTDSEVAAEIEANPELVAEPEAPVTDTLEQDVVALIEATEGETVSETSVTPGAPTEPETAAEANSFDEQLKAIDDVKALAMAHSIAKAFDERAEFETVKDPGNTNIQRTLKKARAQMTTLRAARVVLVTNIDPAVINREIHTGSRYNVYAIGKLGDAVYGLTDGVIKNAINNACMRSLFRFRAAGVAFTGEMAKCAASDKIRVDKAIRDHLVSHTVSASTASTQASSTMQALETLGIVKRSGSGKNPVFDLTDRPVTKRLAEVLSIAA
jgi:hypothetical protein